MFMLKNDFLFHSACGHVQIHVFIHILPICADN